MVQCSVLERVELSRRRHYRGSIKFQELKSKLGHDYHHNLRTPELIRETSIRGLSVDCAKLILGRREQLQWPGGW